MLPKSIEDILVCIHDDPELDEHTRLGRVAREVDAHLVPLATTPRQSECGSGGHSGPRTLGRSLATALRT